MSKSNLICSPQIWLSSLVNGITRHLNSEGIFGPSLSLPRDTYLEPDILECEVKWASGSITTNKASGGDEIPAELFQILKMMPWKCCTQCASKFGKLRSVHRTGKGSVFIPIPMPKAMTKNAQTTAQLHSSHMLKEMLKILQARLQQYLNCDLLDV